MAIREATGGDLAGIGTIYRELYRDSARIAPGYYREAVPDGQFLLNTIHTEYSLLLVAELDGEVVGFALAQQQMTPPFACLVEHRYCYLMDLAVSGRYRGRGIGTRLVDGVRDWARGRGLDHVELHVLPGNEGARRLYESLGFAPAMINLRQEL